MDVIERIKQRDFISMDWGYIKASMVVCDRGNGQGSRYEVLAECAPAEAIHPLIKAQALITHAPHSPAGFLDIDTEFNNLTVYDLDDQLADCVNDTLRELFHTEYAPLV